jgi:excisionase family DNA binding protein
MSTQAPPRLLTTDEVAERLQVNRKTVYRLIWAGQLPAVKLASRGRGALRVREDELEAWLTSDPEGAAAA